MDFMVQNMLKYMFRRPRVVSVEYNCHLPIGSTLTMPPHSDNETDISWNQFDVYYGAGAGAFSHITPTLQYYNTDIKLKLL